MKLTVALPLNGWSYVLQVPAYPLSQDTKSQHRTIYSVLFQ
nr:MAG TPA: hypothetical protein [Caudoviricetes sp.]